MGASFWYSFTPYHQDPRHALREVQQKVLAEKDYYGDEIHEQLEFETLEELAEARDTEEFWEMGTHSVLDMYTIGKYEAPGTVVVLTADEARELLGTDQPTREIFLERHNDLAVGHVERWTGRATTLYQNGQPHEVVFWGVSGD